MIFEVAIAAILGLLLGSFLSVLIERWHTKNGIVTGRSRCPKCEHPLAWFDLVPFFSWLWLRGRCRYCGKPIHWRYPLMELVMAAVLGVYVWQWGIPAGWELIDPVVLFGLVGLMFFDGRWLLLPDTYTLGIAGLVAIRLVFQTPDQLIGAAATAVFLAAAFFLLYLLTRGKGVGLGDVKLGLVIGLLFGFPGALAVTAVAIWAGALVGIILLVLGKATRKTPLPFGSFWATAAVLATLWPEPLVVVSSWLMLS